MISTLDVAFADVSARSLGWALGLPPRAALAVVVVHHDDLRVELRLLGASHQVLVHAEHGLLCSETVACDLVGADPLPESARSAGYDFRSDVQRLDGAGFAAAVEGVEASLEGRADALVGRFPGHPDAITALAVAATGGSEMTWRTWHGYPQTGELVTTTTTLTYPEVAR